MIATNRRMAENSTPEGRERADEAARRIERIGVPKQELALKAGIDRGTLGRALKADPRVENRTWVKIERVLSNLETELGIGVQLAQAAPMTATGETVTSTVEYERGETRATITVSGRADAVADAIRKVLEGDE